MNTQKELLGLNELFDVIVKKDPKKAEFYASQIPDDRLFLKPLIKYQCNDNRFVRELSEKMIFRIKKKNLILKELLVFQRSADMDTEVISRKLLLRHFQEELSYRLLLNFLKSDDVEIVDGARRQLIKKYPNELKLDTLIHFLESKIPSIAHDTVVLLTQLELRGYCLDKLLSYNDEIENIESVIISMVGKMSKRQFDYLMLSKYKLSYSERNKKVIDFILQKHFSEKTTIKTTPEIKNGAKAFVSSYFSQ